LNVLNSNVAASPSNALSKWSASLKSEAAMAKNKKLTDRREPLPENFRSLEEFWTFWDTHSTADYEELMEDVDVDVNIRSK